MARVTVEDCLDKVDNRFELVLLATKRARQIANGAETLVPEENDKPTVIALREIAEGKIDAAMIEEIDKREQEIAMSEMAARALAESETEAMDRL